MTRQKRIGKGSSAQTRLTTHGCSARLLRVAFSAISVLAVWSCGSSALRADPVPPGLVDTSGGVTLTLVTNTIPLTINAVTGDGDAVPVSVRVLTDNNTAYYLAGQISGNFTNANVSGNATSTFFFSNKSGPVNVSNSGNITFQNAPASAVDAIGNAAILALGVPGELTGFGAYPNGQGGDIYLYHYGEVTVVGSGATTGNVTLQPEGFRTAELNGILALSYGEAGSHSDSLGGGDVYVQTGISSEIGMSNSGSTVRTAGISASSTTGPGDRYGSGNSANVTVDHRGQITNSAGAGLGILATATGGVITPADSSKAIGGNVSVTAGGVSSITLNGTTGVGIFAVSEVYTAKDQKKDQSVRAGDVSVVVDAGASIVTGTANSTLSAGVLAVSAGTDFLLNPFSAQNVSGSGNGSAGSVTITQSGNVTTRGTMSVGIAGLSVGGGAIITSNSGSGNTTLGNSGSASDADGSDGAQVSVSNNGTVSTIGSNAFGLVALSSGGGGLLNNLAGGNSSVTGLVIGNDTTGGPAVAGGGVFAGNNGSISTGDGLGGGNASIALVAQSIGSAGGSAGGSHPALFVGDKGGSGGAGGNVTVLLGGNSSISTEDVNSLGILAQSIGGGGGNGANAVGLFVAVGGRGGSGGAGGNVTATLAGWITTQADHSGGLVAQSIGGGGGHGGGATVIGVAASAGIGGGGGSGGRGGNVTASLQPGGAISTIGNSSSGLHLQSVGGGGGTGGASYSGSAGVGFDFSLSLGGTGGTGGDAAAVSGTNSGNIVTGAPFVGPGIYSPNPAGADSMGMIAQSIGGGGGNGGSAISNSLSISGGDEIPVNATFNLAIGGNGSSAGHGGNVSLTNAGSIITWADGSHGMLAHSVGGGGGNGGDSTAASVLLGQSGLNGGLIIGLGGKGSGGGNGGTVAAANSLPGAQIQTYGQNAAGIVVQSIGGGGGNGGLGNGKIYSPALEKENAAATVSIGLGGASGGGGNASATTVTNNGTITTGGSGSQGIVAQSIGGGGGNSGGGSAAGNNNTLNISVTVGGSAGAGGSSLATGNYSTSVINNGAIATSGGDGVAILAQSVGGGGGSGGATDAGAPGSPLSLLMSTGNYSSSVSVGGQGGSGGAAGPVLVQNASPLSTQGGRAFGILAQSISDGGGSGGAANASSNSGGSIYEANVAVGGKGGAAHNSGPVTITNSANTTTAGYGSHAVVAQSIAGGGGIGADGSVDVSADIGLGIQISNAAGSSGSGGNVTVTQTGGIATSGGDAAGILAQSIGGGGGSATTGTAYSLKINPSLLDGIGAKATLGVDLSSSASSDAGPVAVSHGTGGATALSTAGDWSHGIVAQSIGGGGGKAGTIYGTNSPAFAALDVQLGSANGKGQGGAVSITLNGSQVSTGSPGSGGYSAFGILAQSVGGGGGLFSDGSSTSNGTIRLGGLSGNVTGTGSTVSISGSGSVETSGTSAHAVILQSVGGGGGLAGSGSSLTYNGSAVTPAGVSLGGVHSQGDGGNVTFSASLDIQTSGANAFGLVAQSVGGGGGLAATKQGSGGLLGANSTLSSNGSQVNVVLNSSGSISTNGTGSHGLVAQSIGGGGGIANPNTGTGGLSITPAGAFNPPGQAQGYGGNVTIAVSGDITTSGSGASGILAQSIGGGGGLTGAFAGSIGQSGASANGLLNGVTQITQTGGTISAAGANAVAIFAQNVAAGGAGNDITVTISGTVIGGSGMNGVGAWVAGGRTNTLTIQSGGSLSASSKQAIYYSGPSSLSVTNNGTLQGAVWLDGDTQQGNLTNNPAGHYFAEGVVTANFTDSGNLTVGISGSSAATATIEGNYTQNPSAVLNMQIFSPLNNDKILFYPSYSGNFMGNMTVTFSAAYLPVAGDSFTLIGPAANNIFSSSFLANAQNNVTFLTPYSGVEWSFQETLDHSLTLQITAVPEPGTAGLILLGVFATLAVAVRMRYRCPAQSGGRHAENH